MHILSFVLRLLGEFNSALNRTSILVYCIFSSILIKEFR